MTVEREVREYLISELKKLPDKARDIDLILYYYGFGNAEWPTLDEVSIEFNVGTSGGRRSERPRQIIETKFKSNAGLNNFPSLISFLRILKSSKVHFFDELRSKCLKDSLLDKEIGPAPLLRLLHDLGEAKSYKAYTLGLKELTRGSYDKTNDILVGEAGTIESLQGALKSAKTIPGVIGISKLEYLIDEYEASDVDLGILISIIKRDSDSWFYKYDGEEYYLFESRSNTLVTNLKKIKSVAEFVNIDVLSEALSNSLKRNQAPKGRSYPPDDLVKAYLLSSRYTSINGGIVSLEVEPQSLTDIEHDVVEYLREGDIDDYPSISKHLMGMGYRKPTVDKAVFYSPLIHIDKSEGKSYYKYRLVGWKTIASTGELSVYEGFRQRLLKVSSKGTDGNAQVTIRKEHRILTEWLFKDKESEECAICGKTYSVKSLVTAHKKRRADCAENERTDPHIVMPLCNFGCDYMYEKGLIYIDSGKVFASDFLERCFFDEVSMVKPLIGTTIKERWLVGGDVYFRKP